MQLPKPKDLRGIPTTSLTDLQYVAMNGWHHEEGRESLRLSRDDAVYDVMERLGDLLSECTHLAYTDAQHPGWEHPFQCEVEEVGFLRRAITEFWEFFRDELEARTTPFDPDPLPPLAAEVVGYEPEAVDCELFDQGE